VYGSTPQLTPSGTRPRLAQYVNMFQTRVEEHEEWI
jgi:hypothetical protein